MRLFKGGTEGGSIERGPGGGGGVIRKPIYNLRTPGFLVLGVVSWTLQVVPLGFGDPLKDKGRIYEEHIYHGLGFRV